MNPALERAAKAMHRNNGYARPDFNSLQGWDRAWDELFESQREIYRDLVREVVREIREPSLEMVLAGAKKAQELGHRELADEFTAMIDSLLS